jgi:DNA topoisomerase-1
MKLIIVESPAKCKKIEEYCGEGYKCIASYGHLRGLNSLESIKYELDFETTYDIIDDPKKRRHIEFMRKEIAFANEVILATDADREGEAIAWHICDLFDLPINTTPRIIFHEITKNAICKALQSPTTINMNMVHSQKAREIIDMLIGFKVSPVLWKHIARKKEGGLSAGRCQTPALKLVYENQKKCDEKTREMEYQIVGYFTSKCVPFTLNKTFSEEEVVTEFLTDSNSFQHIFTRTQMDRQFYEPPEPLITSRIQQIASNEMKLSPKETMSICQSLYEQGYITYMRTDCKRYSTEFLSTVKKYIVTRFNRENYIHRNIDILSNESDDAKEAHEAIRPTNISLQSLPEEFTAREKKMYKLIWETTLESCMSSAEYLFFNAIITGAKNTKYSRKFEILDFAGWHQVKQRMCGEFEKLYSFFSQLPIYKEVNFSKISATVGSKGGVTHYSESKLVQLLEEKGIGRPSTYASIIDKIQERKYVKKQDIKGKKIECKEFETDGNVLSEKLVIKEFGNEKSKMVLQEEGNVVITFLNEHFTDLFDYEYTRFMEERLDDVFNGNKKWQDVCRECLINIEDCCNKLSVLGKFEVKIDTEHSYIIGKYGHVIKKTDKFQKISFIPLKQGININLSKLKDGGYKITDLIETETETELEKGNTREKAFNLGNYEEKDIILKKGKYGLYAVWGDKNISLGNRPMENVEYDEVVAKINEQKEKPSSIIRHLNDDISIRCSTKGDYIFYKTKKMKKPKFFRLNGLTEDYKTCQKDVLINWIKTENGV